MITLTEENYADVLRKAYLKGFEASGEGWNHEWGCMEPEANKWFLEKREEDLQTFLQRTLGRRGDAERFVWMIERAQTGSIGFGEFVLYPGDALDDVRAVIDSAMTSTKEDGQ